MRWLTVLLLSVPVALAQAPADATELVRKLGHPSFEVREAAEAQLLSLGLSALPALEAGSRDADLEIRTRCLRLVGQTREIDRKSRIQAFLSEPTEGSSAIFPLWTHHRVILGPMSRRKDFVALYNTDPALFDLLHKDRQKGTALAVEKIRLLGTRVLLPQRDRDALTELPALLLVASDPQTPLDAPTLNSLYAGLGMLAQREALRKDLYTQPGMAELLLAVLKRGGEPGYAVTLPLAGDLNLPTARTWSLDILAAAGASPAVRAQALLLLARVGTIADLPRVTQHLEDATAVGQVTVAGKNLQAELRDVALAVAVTLKGEKPADYGFPYFDAVPGLKTLPSPERLGFTSPAERDKARAKWKK